MWQSGSRYSAECNMGNLMDTLYQLLEDYKETIKVNLNTNTERERLLTVHLDLKKNIKVQIIRWQNEEDKKLREVYL